MELKIGKTLKNIMHEKRHTLASISKATGVPKSTISEWLNNRAPNPIQAAKVSNYLGVTLHFLLFGHEDRIGSSYHLSVDDLLKGTFEVTIKKIKEQA